MSDAPCSDPDDADACDTDGILTHFAMSSPDTGWHAALTMLLPDAPDITLLDHARRWVLLYLDWGTSPCTPRPWNSPTRSNLARIASGKSPSPCRQHPPKTGPSSPRTRPTSNPLRPSCAY